MRKKIIIPILVVLLIVVFGTFKYFSSTGIDEVSNKDSITNKVLYNTDNIKTDNKASILINLNTNQVLYQNNIHQSIPVYSVSKVMFLAAASKKIADDNISLDKVVTVSKIIDKVNTKASFSKANLKSGQKFTIRELFKAVMMPSGNDAAILLADELFGSQDLAVQAMNEDVKEWGMNNSSFVSTSGLDGKYLKEIGVEAKDGKNLMSPYDLVILAKKVMNDYPEVVKAGEQLETTIGESNNNPIKLHNVNGVIQGNTHGIEKVYGLKTGSNIENYSNAIMALKNDKNDQKLLAVSLASNSRESLYNDIENMYAYADSLQQLNLASNVKLNAKVGYVNNDVKFSLAKPYYVYVNKGQSFTYAVEDLKHYNKHLNKFYVKDKGQEIGTLAIKEKEQFLDSKPINSKVVVSNQPEVKNVFSRTIEFIVSTFTK